MAHRAVREITREITDAVVLQAPQLKPLVRLMFRVKADPQDRSSYIQLKLMAQQGLDRCPRCDVTFALEGYRRTRTGFVEREVLACAACPTSFVLFERHLA